MKENKYSFKIQFSEDDEEYIAICPEFPGLSAFGETPQEAIKEAEIALELFLETYKDEGRSLPQPNLLKEFSGQIRIRIPKSLHARLALRAEDEGVSLNTLMIQYLAEGVLNNNKTKLEINWDWTEQLPPTPEENSITGKINK